MKIYIMGPSGSGTTSLGRELSQSLSIPQEDSDNMFWENTDPPFTTQKKIEALHRQFFNFISQDKFILSGDVLNWGLQTEELLRTFTHLIYLWTPWEVREARIRKREELRFGKRIKPGGDMYKAHEEFIAWASIYEEDGKIGRNKFSQKKFIKDFKEKSGKVLEIEENQILKEVVKRSIIFLDQ